MSNLFPITTIRGSKPGPDGLIIAGVHGDEYEPIRAVVQLLKELRNTLLCGSLTLVPIVNISAYLTASRLGEDGLDLARTCPGNKSGSITEKVAHEISNLIRKTDFLIDMHTGGNLFDISPLSGYMLHPNLEVLETQRAMAEAFNLPIIWGTSPELNGRTLSVARDENVPAIYTEYRGGGFYPEGITDLADGCKNVLAYFGMLPLEKGVSKVALIIEDNHPGSGHLQEMYPAPEEGIFVPEVKLGQEVKREEILGHIWDFTGKKKTDIFAQQEGTVFLIRAVPMAKKGDALAGILSSVNKD
ncbi:succinylglutamate desuccinylase/aspartoacylase family protein [Cyclobacterium jeungdonense]|uniref:Succinylglutamate desuccinylase/aspartoacylase family protein n=1 Tax=Cyclobacterium jeungdonense TaxID=708087 RepID=A0ABT8C4R6_9BACT|nr:succinylglutamate desuccinylase/aspartoacylase family protein [Cyclobacterium jeungdonense]MDN3687057.1 succinylglutamate desuccinylase/aspartoacylase family protein [Cyclobacterium jeungdonense]